MSNTILSKQAEPIAITGISCRFPGGMNTLDSFWEVLINKKDVVSEFPEGRINNIDDMVDPGRAPGKIISKSGGFLEKIDEFDAKFFRISPREAEKMDPQQRILLELTYEALEDSGVKMEDAWGSRTSVFTGVWTNDYEHRMLKAGHDLDVYATTGTGRYGASGRISYIFNFQGPCMTLDTACSTSIVAVHLAAQSLLNGESNMAIAAAANLIMDSFISVGYSRSGLLAPYGRCRFGAIEPRGYVRSEGAAVVVMKRLSQAIADGDNIYALVTGSACNSDGQSHKYMLAPSFITQEVLIRDAIQRAGIKAKDIQYVEAHGTGTKAGDPVELKSIPNAIKEGRDPNDKFYVGSVKTNIGHTEAASGLAALIKTILAIRHRTIPASLHSNEPKRNPDIPWDELPLIIPSDNVPWPHPEKTLIAGVNSFGISGINAHAIVQEAPEQEKTVEKFSHSYFLLPVSAAAETALKDYLLQYLEDLKGLHNDNAALLNWIKNIVFRKSGLAERVIFCGKNAEELQQAIQAYLSGTPHENVLTGIVNTDLPRKIAAIFPGQGSQWQGMGKELYEQEPIFRETIDQCESAYHKYVKWSLKKELFRTDEEALSTIDIIQPLIVAIEVAIAKLLQSWGLTLDAVVGHSMGEAAAAYISGAISLDEMANIICTRSLLLKRVSGKGAMGYIGLPAEQVEEAIKDKSLVNIGVVNSPQSAVISGDPDTVDAMLKAFEDKGAFCRRVKVDVASHSPQMNPLMADLETALASISPSQTQINFYSTVLGSITDGSTLGKTYWTQNLRDQVRFGETIQKILDDGHTVFVECSPHPVLTQPVQENIQAMALEAGVSGTMLRDQSEIFSLSKAFGAAWCNGANVNWKKYYGTSWERVSLPLYPWQKDRYWFDESLSGVGQANHRKDGTTGHPLLASLNADDAENGIWIWETSIGLQQFPYLSGHKIGESIVFPAAAYLEIIAAAAEEALGAGDHCWENVKLKLAFSIQEKGATSIQVKMIRSIGDAYDLVISKWDTSGDKGNWTELVTAKVLANYASGSLLSEAESWKIQQAKKTSAEEHYAATTAMFLPYEGVFKSLKNLATAGNIIKASIQLDETVKSTKYLYHPALLDGAIQAMLQPMYNKYPGRTIVPVSLDKWRQISWEKGVSKINITIFITATDNNKVVCDAIIVDDQNRLLAEWKGFTLQALERTFENLSDIDHLLYRTTWHPIDLPGNIEVKGACALFAPDQESATVWQKSLSSLGQPYITILPGNYWENTAEQITIQPSLEAEHDKLWQALKGSNISRIIYAWPLSADKSDPVNSQRNSIFPLIKTLKTLSSSGIAAPELWIITANSRQVAENEHINTAMAPIWGMVNVLLNELPEFQPARIDLESAFGQEDVNSAVTLILSAVKENELALRKGTWFMARLENDVSLSTDAKKVSLQKAQGKPFEAVMSSPGLLDNLALREKVLHDPEEQEIQVEVMASGINFMNLMSALGIYPGKKNGFATLGLEFSGIVKKVGSGVKTVAIGNQVMGMGYDTIASNINIDHRKICSLPQGLNMTDAARIPVVYLTGWYALDHLARLSKGERVLIHAATGGVGLSAIQIAELKGAEIFATAGTAEKRAYLREMGIQHVYDSRSLTFYEQILKDTEGEGVDVVLNSLTGEAMHRSLRLLKKYGRFLEIGKKDVYGNSRLGMEAFSRNISYYMIDLEMLAADRPEQIGEMLKVIKIHFEKGDFSPLPTTVFALADLKNAFAFMSKSKHTGKIVIDLQDKDQLIEPLQGNGTTIRPDATYLLTGGYGGLGLTFSAWLIGKGARHLVLTGRSGPKGEAAQKIALWQKEGINIQIATPDLEKIEELEVLINALPSTAPLKGVMHFAGLLDDAAFINITEDQLLRTFGPKVGGAWNLHQITKNRELDFWVVPSSSTILFGSPGQAAYVGANSFLDALVQERRAMGLPAQSIQWGTVAGVGLAAAESNRLERLAEEGVAPLDTATCISLYEKIAASDQAVSGAFRFDLGRWENTYRTAAQNPFFTLLRKEAKTTATAEVEYKDFLKTLADDQERILHIEERLKEKVGQVVKMDPEKMATKTPFKTLGIDSLMSIQLKNQLEKAFGLTLSVTSFWTYANIRDYTKYLAEELGVGTVEDTETVSTTPPKAMTSDNDMPDMDDYDADELSRLLEEEMKDL